MDRRVVAGQPIPGEAIRVGRAIGRSARRRRRRRVGTRTTPPTRRRRRPNRTTSSVTARGDTPKRYFGSEVEGATRERSAPRSRQVDRAQDTLEHFPEKWTPVFRKKIRQVS